MAVTYYYNVYLQQFLNGVWVNITTQNSKINFLDFKTGSSGVLSNITDQAGNQPGSQSDLQWVIKAYRNDNGTITQLNDDQVRVVKETVPANPANNVLEGITTWNNLYFSAQINKTILNIQAIKFPYPITPSFRVTHKGAPGFPANNVVIPRANIAGRDFTGVQTVTFTKAEAFPAIPRGLIEELDIEVAGQAPIRQTQNIHWNKGLKQYVGIKEVVNNTTKETTYFALYYNPGQDGAKVKEVEVGKDPKKFLNNNDGPAYKAAMAILIDAINSAKVTNVKVPKDSDSGGGSIGNVAPKEPKDKERWNPPFHRATKGSTRSFEWVNKDGKQQVVNRLSAAPELGRIYQDKNSALAVNINPEVSKKGQLWGFRFMYNPETINYSVSGTPFDYTLGNADPAILITGNMSINLTLLLNRQADMTELLSTNSPTKSPYTPELSEASRLGILNRGTEYDLEFLYRVCNGDPSTTTGQDALLGYDGITSDSGLLKQTPVWMHLHNSYKIFGAVANLDVTHRVFDRRMVPILTEVKLTINRYPAIVQAVEDLNAPVSEEFKKRYSGGDVPPPKDGD
jgi:hypothetical protein